VKWAGSGEEGKETWKRNMVDFQKLTRGNGR